MVRNKLQELYKSYVQERNTVHQSVESHLLVLERFIDKLFEETDADTTG